MTEIEILETMKIIPILILFFSLSIGLMAQRQDSLEYRIQQDFSKFNKEHMTGTVLLFSGTVLSTIGLTSYNLSVPNGNKLQTGCIIIGTLMSVTGVILTIDAFAFLGGKKSIVIHPAGFVYTF